MLQRILELDQCILGVAQYISNIAYGIGVSNFRLAPISYFPAIGIIAIALIIKDRIFTREVSSVGEVIGIKILVLFALIVCFIFMARFSKMEEEKWSNIIKYKNQEKNNWDTVIIRVGCLVAGFAIAIFAIIDLVACYLSVFFLTNACAFYFLSCEPGNTNLLNQENKLMI